MPPPSTPRPPEVGAIEVAIVEYLSAHPLAADSAEGVARWWLPGGGPPWPAVAVLQALQQLCLRGVLRSVRGADGTVIYARGDRSGPH